MIVSFLRRIRLGFVILALASPAAAAAPGRAAGAEDLQSAVDRAMARQSGAFVVLDVASGTLLASHRLDIAARTLARPGSTLKPFVLRELLESHGLDAEKKLKCRRVLRIGPAQMDCTHPAAITELDAADAIAYSCNSYVAQVSLQLAAKEMVELLRRAGLDSPTGLAKDEAIGRIDLPRNPEALQLLALGSRDIVVTPLELLEAYRKLALQARSGKLGAAAPVFLGLRQSIAFGMAHAANVDAMETAGKTGTASSAESAQSHGLFVGYAPAANPEIAVVVFLERGRGMDAAAVAQPVFAQFAREKRNP
jgi:peptidoglycan glycosyltransferase